MNAKNSDFRLKGDEERLVSLFRLLEVEQSEILTEAARRALSHYAVDPSILNYSNWKGALQEELSGDDQQELLAGRLFRCLPDSGWHPWLAALENWKEDVFESSWDDILMVLMGSSEFDETNAGMLQEGIATVYDLNKSSVVWEPEESLKEYPVEKLVDFIQDWRTRILQGLERRIGRSHLEAAKPDEKDAP